MPKESQKQQNKRDMGQKKPESDEVKYTDIWLKYRRSHQYLQLKGVVSKTNRNWNFYIGNQWVGMKTGGEELPSVNIIKPIVKYKVSTVSQQNLTANYSDASSDNQNKYEGLYREFNRKFDLAWDKAKMTDFSWRNNKAAAVQGDSYAYFWSSEINDQPQLISNTSILFGDENIESIQDQPYIIIRERLDLKTVVEKAKENGIPDSEIQTIGTDNETDDQIYNQDEVTDKVTVLLYFTKINGVVNVARTTKTCIFEPLRPLAGTRNGKSMGGLETYPIISFKWEPKPNSMRGVGEVECLLPNQIELNKTLARRAMAVKLAAFPRLAYDTTAIENPADLDKVGKAIGVTTGNAQSISQAIAYLNATNISSDADSLFNDLINQTKDLAGAGDNALGNVDPERASGQAIIAVRDQTQVPLNEQINGFKRWVEEVAMLWLDMLITYHPDDFEVDVHSEVYDQMGMKQDITVRRKVSPKELVAIRPTVRIDISEDNKWTKLAEQQAVDNLLKEQAITFEEYAEMTAEDGPIPKAKLMKVVSDRQQQQKIQTQIQQQQQMEMQAQAAAQNQAMMAQQGAGSPTGQQGSSTPGTQQG